MTLETTTAGAPDGTLGDQRGVARARAGTDGFEAVEEFLPVVRLVGTNTLIASIGLAIVAGLPLGALAVLGLPVTAGLGEQPGLVLTFTAAFAAGSAAGAMVAVLAAAERTRFAVMASVVIAAGSIVAGTISPLSGFAIAGIGSGIIGSVIPGVLAMTYHAAIRARVLAAYRVAFLAGPMVAAIVTAGSSVSGTATVVVPFTALAVLAGVATARAIELEGPAKPADDVTTLIRPTEGLRRVTRSSTIRRALVGYATVGVLAVAWHVHLVRFLTQAWGLGLWARGLVYGATALAAAAAAWIVASPSESRFRSDPTRVARSASASLMAASLATVILSYWPSWGGAVLAIAAFGLLAGALVSLDVVTFGAARRALRPHAAAVTVLATAGGLVFGVIVLGAVERRGGADAALLVAGVLSFFGGVTLRGLRHDTARDVESAASDEIDAAEIARLAPTGETPPLLSCRNLDFSYGQVQVLFGVDFAVRDGEMVALLGTNGAGKSTLLRVISGLGTPSRGSVRLDGEDITYVDPAGRVARGITQIPGGKAAFGPLTVAENLRVFGYSLGRDRKAVAKGIEESFAAFPRLAERRNLPSNVLSGGERQMLALSKALILNPRLLLIDELSLGLAPVIVAQLLDMVRRINATGTAIVLVEQSVNVALSLVEHAYYMEKGEIRFDGTAQGLLDRPDVLRSVYLKGASQGLGADTTTQEVPA